MSEIRTFYVMWHNILAWNLNHSVHGDFRHAPENQTFFVAFEIYTSLDFRHFLNAKKELFKNEIFAVSLQAQFSRHYVCSTNWKQAEANCHKMAFAVTLIATLWLFKHRGMSRRKISHNQMQNWIPKLNFCECKEIKKDLRNISSVSKL